MDKDSQTRTLSYGLDVIFKLKQKYSISEIFHIAKDTHVP